MSVIEAKLISDRLRAGLKSKLDLLDLVPNMVVVLVGDNPASELYVKNKGIAAAKLGFQSSLLKLPDSVPEAELLARINELNMNPDVTGILVQLPLPSHINPEKVIDSIDPAKDLDCFHVSNVGKLAINQCGVRPCTPHGCLYLVKSIFGSNLSGLDAVILGRSNIVGKPMALMLLNESASVTVLHSKSTNVPARCREADIIIAAVGKPALVKGDWVSDKSIVIDVGINKDPLSGKVIGDVDFDEVNKRARAVTTVPGGVGPMTITFLLINAVILAASQKGLSVDYADLLIEKDPLT